MSSLLPQVLVLVALAVFSVVALVRSSSEGSGGPVDRDQLRGFVYVGAAAALALAAIVVVLGIVSPASDQALGLAIFGLFGCCAYQLGALIVLTAMARRPRTPRGGRHQR